MHHSCWWKFWKLLVLRNRSKKLSFRFQFIFLFAAQCIVRCVTGCVLEMEMDFSDNGYLWFYDTLELDHPDPGSLLTILLIHQSTFPRISISNMKFPYEPISFISLVDSTELARKLTNCRHSWDSIQPLKLNAQRYKECSMSPHLNEIITH